MKKLLLGILISGTVLSASAQVPETKTVTTTTTEQKYVYYPSVNVYFNEVTGEYWYQDKGATEWTKTKTLPSTIIVEKTAQFPIVYEGTDPWKNNMSDVKKYKVKKNGAVKIKMKDKE